MKTQTDLVTFEISVTLKIIKPSKVVPLFPMSVIKAGSTIGISPAVVINSYLTKNLPYIYIGKFF